MGVPPIISIFIDMSSPRSVAPRLTTVDVAGYLNALQTEGALLGDVAAASTLTTPIPTCPGWQMRDLVRHVGGIHRWATGYVATPRTEPWDVDLDDVVGAWPNDGDLVDWYRAGHAALVAALAAAPPDLECYTFLAAPSPLAMWARRQAHETAVHRVDAESPTGAITRFAPDFATDGIDELLTAFLSRPGRYPGMDPPRSVVVTVEESAAAWHVRIGPTGPTTTRTREDGDLRLHGPASEVYLFLWNRAGSDAIEVAGDRDLLAYWSEEIRIRWS
jgi:uncharacterized protein (TIGR03083 family)